VVGTVKAAAFELGRIAENAAFFGSGMTKKKRKSVAFSRH
jgi:hypothetical protein